MTPIFPSAEWLESFKDKLNSDQKYAEIARNWEGDIYFIVDPDGKLEQQMVMYLDLWHGQCRAVEVVEDIAKYSPAFTLRAAYGNFAAVVSGKLDPMQAMMTRKLDVKGNMAVMMRSVPTVLDFVRCAREITKEIL